MPTEAAWPGYLADPFVLATDDGWVAYGTREAGRGDGTAFEALTSTDLRTWTPIGAVLTIDPDVGSDYWAPEVMRSDGAWWMYFSAGRGIEAHHLRVARADLPTGPFVDQGVDLTPDELFAIDPHPFQDADGTRYLFYAHDVLDAERPGTHLVVRRMTTSTELEPTAHPVLAPNAMWQRYEPDRLMYGRRTDWYTLEGPTVVRRDGQYVLLFSGGSWEGPDYGVGSATAPTPLGPWTHTSDVPDVLSSATTGQIGPGHCSVLGIPGGDDAIVYHAWDATGSMRQMHLAVLQWSGTHPHVEVGHRPVP